MIAIWSLLIQGQLASDTCIYCVAQWSSALVWGDSWRKCARTSWNPPNPSGCPYLNSWPRSGVPAFEIQTALARENREWIASDHFQHKIKRVRGWHGRPAGKRSVLDYVAGVKQDYVDLKRCDLENKERPCNISKEEKPPLKRVQPVGHLSLPLSQPWSQRTPLECNNCNFRRVHSLLGWNTLDMVQDRIQDQSMVINW